MVELILLSVMAVSVLGMAVSCINDPLSERSWNDFFK